MTAVFITALILFAGTLACLWRLCRIAFGALDVEAERLTEHGPHGLGCERPNFYDQDKETS